MDPILETWVTNISKELSRNIHKEDLKNIFGRHKGDIFIKQFVYLSSREQYFRLRNISKPF